MYILLFNLDCTEEVKGGFYYSINNKAAGFLTSIFGTATVLWEEKDFDNIKERLKKNILLELEMIFPTSNTNVKDLKILYTDKELILPQALVLTTVHNLFKVGAPVQKELDKKLIIDVLEENDYWCKKIPIGIKGVLGI